MKIPILVYHALFDKDLSRENYSINKEEFERQIRYLSENGFRSFLIDDFFRTHKAIDSNRKGIAITFDDGNISDYSVAFPTLKKYGFVATFFITVNWIGTRNFVNWQHLKEMIKDGMSIQSHSLTHSFLSDLSTVNLYKELYESKNIIEENLDKTVRFISIPGGFFSKKVLNMAEDVGYKGAYTSVPGLTMLDSKEMEFTLLNRFVITRKTSFQNFKDIVGEDWRYITTCKAQYYLKAGIKKILGNQKYYAIWSKFFREVQEKI